MLMSEVSSKSPTTSFASSKPLELRHNPSVDISTRPLFIRRVCHSWDVLVLKAKKFSVHLNDNSILDLFETEPDSDSESDSHAYIPTLTRSPLTPPKENVDMAQSELPALPSTSPREFGPSLWETRRQEWLKCDDLPKANARSSHNVLSGIPRDKYVGIYKALVDLRRTLKQENAINLGELAAVINAGWTANERWDRAAKGLP